MLTAISKSCLVACLMLVFVPLACRAQYMGTFSQQTVAQSFTGDYTGGGTAVQHFSIQNLGQAAHQVTYNWGGATNTGSVMLEGSIDGTHWVALAAGGESPNVHSFTANGYFPFLRISVNAEGNTISAGSTVLLQYTGYQNPIPTGGYFETFDAVDAGAYTQIQSGDVVQSFINPAVLGGFACSNPNGTTAYLEVFYSAVAPTLGSVTPRLEIPIAANANVVYSGPPIVGNAPFYFGAATASGGATPVTTPVHCTGTINPFGPFAPILFAVAN